MGKSIPILYKYIVKETLGPFLFSLFIFTGLLFLGRILKIVDLVVNKNIPIGDTVLLFSYIIPSFLEIAMPMALLLGILLAFGRLNADSELIVIRASGVSLKKLALPLIALATATCIFSLLLSFWIRPWANYNLGLGLFEIAKLKATSGITPGVFNDFGPLTIYAESIDENTGKLNNVLISDRRDSDVSRNFLAKHGQIISDEEQRTLSLQLYDGSIQEGVGLNFNYTLFQVNKILLPHSQLMDENYSQQKKRSTEMQISELISAIVTLEIIKGLTKEDNLQLSRYWVELQKRIVVPTSCFAVTLLALALSAQPNRNNKTWGASGNVILGICLILIYYLILGLTSALASQSLKNISYILWLPNIIFFITGAYWLRQIGSDRWQAVSYVIGNLFLRLGKKLGLLES